MSERKRVIRDTAKRYLPFLRLIGVARRRFSKVARESRAIEVINVDDGISLARNSYSNCVAFLPYAERSQFDKTQKFILWNGFHSHMIKKYLHENFAVKHDDLVIDCGGFVGAFSVAANKMGASKIFYVEPTPKSRRCAELNFALYDCRNVCIKPFALGEEKGLCQLNLSSSGADNSLIEPDAGSTGESLEVSMTTIDELAESEGLEEGRTFLKVEAEGFEIEVLKGMKTFRPRTIVVDVTPERNGESPREEVLGILIAKGYKDFHHSGRCLFASI